MKAKEYCEIYFEKFMGAKDAEEAEKVFVELFNGFVGEVRTIAKTRHVKNPAALKGIVHELNDKWNALARLLLAKTTNTSIIKKDDFEKFWEDDKAYEELIGAVLGTEKMTPFSLEVVVENEDDKNESVTL